MKSLSPCTSLSANIVIVFLMRSYFIKFCVTYFAGVTNLFIVPYIYSSPVWIIRLSWKGCNHSSLYSVLNNYLGVWTITRHGQPVLNNACVWGEEDHL